MGKKKSENNSIFDLLEITGLCKITKYMYLHQNGVLRVEFRREIGLSGKKKKKKKKKKKYTQKKKIYLL